jgi:hypothetical protein
MTSCLRRLTRAALALSACLALASPAQAVQYETDIDIDNESDLYDLAARQEIGPETLETLIDLLNEGVDLTRPRARSSTSCPGSPTRTWTAILKYRGQRASSTRRTW